jgi:hypothetical protein
MKQEIMDAYWAGYKEGQYSGDKTAEEYYNEIHKEEVSTQDPAICNYSGLRPIEGYKEDIDKEIKIERGDINFMYKWIRDKSGK